MSIGVPSYSSVLPTRQGRKSDRACKPVCGNLGSCLGSRPATVIIGNMTEYLLKCPTPSASFLPLSEMIFPSLTHRETKAQGNEVICVTSKECGRDASLDLLAPKGQAPFCHTLSSLLSDAFLFLQPHCCGCRSLSAVIRPRHCCSSPLSGPPTCALALLQSIHHRPKVPPDRVTSCLKDLNRFFRVESLLLIQVTQSRSVGSACPSPLFNERSTCFRCLEHS